MDMRPCLSMAFINWLCRWIWYFCRRCDYISASPGSRSEPQREKPLAALTRVRERDGNLYKPQWDWCIWKMKINSALEHTNIFQINVCTSKIAASSFFRPLPYESVFIFFGHHYHWHGTWFCNPAPGCRPSVDIGLLPPNVWDSLSTCVAKCVRYLTKIHFSCITAKYYGEGSVFPLYSCIIPCIWPFFIFHACFTPNYLVEFVEISRHDEFAVDFIPIRLHPFWMRKIVDATPKTHPFYGHFVYLLASHQTTY